MVNISQYLLSFLRPLWFSCLNDVDYCRTTTSMKGKGKGDRSMKSSDDCPLQFPNLTPIDHTRTCPRYTDSKFSVGTTFITESVWHINLIMLTLWLPLPGDPGINLFQNSASTWGTGQCITSSFAPVYGGARLECYLQNGAVTWIPEIHIGCVFKSRKSIFCF